MEIAIILRIPIWGNCAEMIGGGLMVSKAKILARTSTNSGKWSTIFTGE